MLVRCCLFNVVASVPGAYLIWYYMFYFWIWVGFLIYIVLICWAFYISSIYRSGNTEVARRLTISILKNIGYPVIVFICWAPISINELAYYLFPTSDAGNDTEFYNFCLAAMTIQGALTALLTIFIYEIGTMREMLKKISSYSRGRARIQDMANGVLETKTAIMYQIEPV